MSLEERKLENLWGKLNTNLQARQSNVDGSRGYREKNAKLLVKQRERELRGGHSWKVQVHATMFGYSREAGQIECVDNAGLRKCVSKTGSRPKKASRGAPDADSNCSSTNSSTEPPPTPPLRRRPPPAQHSSGCYEAAANGALQTRLSTACAVSPKEWCATR